MQQHRSSQSRPTTLASSFRRMFYRSSSRTSNKDELASPAATTTTNRKAYPSGSKNSTPQKSATIGRSKSNKEVTLPRTSVDDISLKSSTLPSPMQRPPPLSPVTITRSPPNRYKTHHHNNSISPTRRTHLPVTIMKSPSSAPPVHHTLPRQLRQTASSWDISPTGNPFQPYLRENEKQKLSSKAFSPSSHFGGSLIGPVTAASNSVMDLSHTYSEPYHWLIPPPPTTTKPPAVTLSNSCSVLELPPPPLPPRPGQHQVQTEGSDSTKHYTNISTVLSHENHDYMSISSLTLDPKPDVSDYQQPIVTQTTPLPSCLKHRQQTLRAESNDFLQKECSPDEEEEEETKEEERDVLVKESNSFIRQQAPCRTDTRRITVVILHDDRTLKV